MFNMATMAADECREDAEERAYYRWIDKASQLLGQHVALVRTKKAICMTSTPMAAPRPRL
jgi:hypothetical protein